MPATYDPIATFTLTGPNDQITFSSIPGTYTDLRVVFVGRMNTTASVFNFFVNGDTTSLYSNTFLTGDGTTASSNRVQNVKYWGPSSSATLSATIPALVTIDVFNYASTSVNKAGLVTGSYDQNGSGITSVAVSLYRSTNAITSVTIGNSGFNNFATGATTVTLYGILRA